MPKHYACWFCKCVKVSTIICWISIVNAPEHYAVSEWINKYLLDKTMSLTLVCTMLVLNTSKGINNHLLDGTM